MAKRDPKQELFDALKALDTAPLVVLASISVEFDAESKGLEGPASPLTDIASSGSIPLLD
jgi:hypothetical protein